MTASIAIIDYGMGNLHSVASAFSRVAPDSHVTITADAEVIANADKVLFRVCPLNNKVGYEH
jgi:glutamine amidotransferase